MSEVVVVTTEPEPEPEPEPTPEPTVIDVVLAEQVGALIARVQYIEDLVSLHSHESLVERGDLQECEERICNRIDAIVPVPEPEPEPIIEPIPEPEPEPEPESSPDDPPKSRKKRKSIADWYYGK